MSWPYLAWDSYECHMTDSMRKYLKEMNLDVIIKVGAKIYIQPPDVYRNKPFKARMTKLYDQWFSEGIHQFTEGGNMKSPSRKKITEWVLDALYQLSKENIKFIKYCDLNLANDGTEDDFICCLKVGQSCKPGRQKLDSQLSILVDESDAVNTLFLPLMKRMPMEK